MQPIRFCYLCADMRRAIALLLLAIISQTLLLKLGVVAYYTWNKAYIAQNLCENRDKPALGCCGKCYLRKQLARADHGIPKNLAAQLLKGEISPALLPRPICLRRYFAIDEKPGFHYATPFQEKVALSVFHPPG